MSRQAVGALRITSCHLSPKACFEGPSSKAVPHCRLVVVQVRKCSLNAGPVLWLNIFNTGHKQWTITDLVEFFFVCLRGFLTVERRFKRAFFGLPRIFKKSKVD